MEMEKEQAMLSAEKKRTKKILMVLVPATIIVIILAIVAAIYANMAGGKKSASSQDFIIAATTAVNGTYDEEKAANIAISVVEQIENKDIFKDILVCKIDENNSAYYYIFENKRDAQNFFAGNARKLKKETKNALPENIKQEKFENYSYYTVSADGKYATIIRVNKTVFFANVDEAHTDKIKKIVKMLDY